MNWNELCVQLELGSLQSVVELDPGTVSHVWKLHTDMGDLLVRTLKDRQQGEREWSVFCHLRDKGFAAMPAIYVPCFEWEGMLLQVQEHLSGAMPDPALPGMAASMAELVRALSDALEDHPGGRMIHGDLGPWNLLLREDGRIAVVDFGEICPGDPYFDYASLFAGVINHVPEEKRPQICGEYLSGLDCDRRRLLEQMHLWAEQGVARWSGINDRMAARFRYAERWAKEHIYEL